MSERRTAINNKFGNVFAEPDDTSGMNRASRRRLKKIINQATRRSLEIIDSVNTVPTTPVAQILDNEDDLVMLERELTVQEALQSQMICHSQIYNIYLKADASDKPIRSLIFGGKLEIGAGTQAYREVNPEKMRRFVPELNRLLGELRKIKVYYTDKEEGELVNFMQGSDFSGREIIQEVLRSRRESIGLIRMQIDWLKPKEKPSERIQEQPNDNVENKIISSGPLETEVNLLADSFTDTTGFSLSEWEMYFTDRVWSAQPSQLHPVDTSSEEVAIGSIENLTRGYRTIKPVSILRAVAHHLVDKTTIQKALATRFSYDRGKGDEWVKVKRGKDRIGLLIDELGRRVVFCIEGRDIVYRQN